MPLVLLNIFKLPQKSITAVFVLAAFATAGSTTPTVAGEAVLHRQGGETTAGQWDVLDIRFRVDRVPGNPIDVAFSADFSSEQGQSLSVKGFYNGNDEYLIRFTPPSAGTWSYSTSSRLEPLDQQSGRLTVRPAASHRKGGVQIDPDHKLGFAYANGESYFPIAFESDWLFALDAENPGGIPKTQDLVDTLAETGFNQVVMNVYAHDVNWPKDKQLDPQYDYGSPSVFPFLGSNESPDHRSLNIEYFKRLDRVIDYLDQKGIVAHLMIYVWNKQVAWPEANSEADNRYFDYVVRRYQAYPNLVWDISKEALGYGHTDVQYITDRIDRLRQIDAFDRLVTVHDYGYCRKYPEHVDFVSVQLWQSELYGVMRNVRKAIPGKPILNIEHGGYERGPYVVFTGNYVSPEVCLERAYQCVFAGTYPTHYWQGAAWNVVIPDITELAPDARPKLEYYRHMREFVDRFQVDQLIAGDKKSNAGFCLHNGKDLHLYYVPKECDFMGLRLPKDRGDTMKLTWFNPFTGQSLEPFEMKITQWPSVKVPEGDRFQILICELQNQD
ncbi:DUF4038 domain-containing protein [Stieleria sp. ICT_E10.1]|uniref:DUF5060 domain-containing protein n=1 Tax=Stieleria sedimenti TaxID=2976331 RepID=UPI00217F9163|nr:DUF5060 domain-containing protein [Stieleria sedimenti]MCS7466044.1 DUF4038 domain-containing protein [Stieleria sedimenti]